MTQFEILVQEMRAAQRDAKSRPTLQTIRKAQALEEDVDRELRAIRKAEKSNQPAAYSADLFQEAQQ